MRFLGIYNYQKKSVSLIKRDILRVKITNTSIFLMKNS